MGTMFNNSKLIYKNKPAFSLKHLKDQDRGPSSTSLKISPQSLLCFILYPMLFLSTMPRDVPPSCGTQERALNWESEDHDLNLVSATPACVH